MEVVRRGNRVRVHYTGTLDDGSTFDSSSGRELLEFTVGAGQVIPGFGGAVAGMRPGDERTVTIPAAEAYGARRDELVIEVERARLPEDLDPEVGQQLQLSQEGQSFMVRVTDVSEERISWTRTTRWPART